MKQTTEINLYTLTKESHPFGNELGRLVFNELKFYLDSKPAEILFAISLKDIVITDASFPRESVISIARMYRNSKWFYLKDVANEDILDNWDYAAIAMEQPLLYWSDKDYKLLGSNLTSSGKELLDYVLTKEKTFVSEVALDLNITVQNASTRLKKLANEGYLMRVEAAAESGGIEFIYQAIK